ECQQVLSAVSGNFSSPHFPNIYPNNINCHWSITLEAGYRIKLFFPVVDLEGRNSLSDECDYDSVSVYDGDSQADALIGRWCGRERPPSLISKGNKLLVVLSTDRNEAHRGFTATYLGGKCVCACLLSGANENINSVYPVGTAGLRYVLHTVYSTCSFNPKLNLLLKS
ncbi:hypothetical protein GOODEAATRI_023474, partial [Goodea atripinnis]